MLGASPARVWREIDLPIVNRAVLVGAGFAFAVCLGEFGATLFIVRPDAPTMPVAIYRLLSQPGVACLRPGDGHGRAADGRDRRQRARVRPAAGRLAKVGRLMLELVDVRVAYGDDRRRRRRLADDRRARDRRAARAERLGQVDAAARDRRARATDGRQRSRSTAATSPTCPVHERGFGLMFQDYVLFPQRDVRGNVAFGLGMRGDARAVDRQARRRGARAGRAERLRGAADDRAVGRRAAAGGAGAGAGARAAPADARRAAGRARPRAADAAARRPRRALRASCALPIIYVTHDQEEAFTVADRVVIMRDGRRRRSARRSSSGRGHPMRGRPVPGLPQRRRGGRPRRRRAHAVGRPVRYPVEPDGEVTLVLRPEALTLAADGPIDGTVTARRFHGDHVRVWSRHASGRAAGARGPRRPTARDR